MEIPFVLIGCFLVISSAELPRNWQLCGSSEARDKCLRDAAQIAYNSLIKGEKILNVPSLDPLKDVPITLTDTGSGKGPLTVKFVLSNYSLVGYKSGRVDNLKIDCSKLKVKFDISMKDDVTIWGHYNGSGRVLLLPVYGKGDFKFIFEDYKLQGEASMSAGNKKGDHPLKLDKFSLHIHASRIHSRLENLFNGNKLLGENMNKVFNENWRALFDELSPSLDREFARILGRYVKLAVDRVPSSAFCPK